MAAGVHIPLSALLRDPDATAEVRQYAAGAFWNLSADPANHQSLLVDGVHNRLSALLSDQLATARAKERAAGALRNLELTPPPRGFCVIA